MSCKSFLVIELEKEMDVIDIIFTLSNRMNVSIAAACGQDVRRSNLNLNSTPSSVSLLNPIEHKIDNHPGHGDIEPNRKGPAGNLHVFIKLFVQTTIQRSQCQGDDDRSKNYVGDEEGKVDWPNPTLARKRYRAHLVVMGQIGNEKEAREAKSCHHADLVARYPFPSDKDIPDAQEYGARPVEEGIDSR